MSTCNTCHKPIDWDTKKREALGTNRPLNPDGTIHMHTPGQFTHTDTGPSVYTPASSSDKTPEKTPQNGSSTSNMPPLVSLTQEEISVLKDIAAAVLKRK